MILIQLWYRNAIVDIMSPEESMTVNYEINNEEQSKLPYFSST